MSELSAAIASDSFFAACAIRLRSLMEISDHRQVSAFFLKPWRAVDDGRLRLLQPTRDQVVQHRAPSRLALSAHAANGKQEIVVSSRSISTRTVVPSRINRMISFVLRSRLFHASQSPFIFRHTRLTVSFDTAPRNSDAKARQNRACWCPQVSCRRSAHRPLRL